MEALSEESLCGASFNDFLKSALPDSGVPAMRPGSQELVDEVTVGFELQISTALEQNIV